MGGLNNNIGRCDTFRLFEDAFTLRTTSIRSLSGELPNITLICTEFEPYKKKKKKHVLEGVNGIVIFSGEPASNAL
jgi:hypothetical protein